MYWIEKTILQSTCDSIQSLVKRKYRTKISQSQSELFIRYNVLSYKILSNILFLNRDLHRFKLINYLSCSFCNKYPKTIDHIFVEYIKSKNNYFQISKWFEKTSCQLQELNKTNIILEVDDITKNFIILIYKLSLYKSRETSKVPSLSMFKNQLKPYEFIERGIAIKKKKKLERYLSKWKYIIEALKWKKKTTTNK